MEQPATTFVYVDVRVDNEGLYHIQALPNSHKHALTDARLLPPPLGSLLNSLEGDQES